MTTPGLATTIKNEASSVAWKQVAAEAGIASAHGSEEAGQISHAVSASAEKNLSYELTKRFVDIAGVSVILLMTLPLVMFVALSIMISSPGPVLFRQKRLGKGGKAFWCYKFRTMVVDAEAFLKKHPELNKQFQENFKLKDDPEITKIGKFLRKTSLDELPQLFNVLKGEMTLVGPRPIVPPEIEKYGAYSDKLLSVRPGLSGVWQVCGRSDTSYPERIQMDMMYIDNRSTSLDLHVIFMTAISVFRRSGAY